MSIAPGPVLFDLDGTLADTFLDLHAALDAALSARDLPPSDPDSLRGCVSAGSRAMLTRALAERTLPGPEIETLLAEFLDRYADMLGQKTHLFEGMSEVLQALERQGRPLAVVTNKRARFTVPLLRALELDGRFQAIVSGDDAPRAKPHPDPLHLALEQLGCPAAGATYVGDARNDIVASRAAGVSAVAAAWGYLAPGDDPAQWGADAVADRPRDLLGWFAARS